MFPQSIQNLITQLSKLPDIGPRAAARLVFYFLNQKQEDLDELSLLIKSLKTKIHLCQQCFNIADTNNNLCFVCQNSKRSKEMICIVEGVLNIPPIEKTRRYQGLYHVLGGVISPPNGIGPSNLRISELISRIKASQPATREVIFALSPTTEGDTTILYTERLLQPLKIKTSRLARGLSFGSDLQYADENTLINAFLGRK